MTFEDHNIDPNVNHNLWFQLNWLKNERVFVGDADIRALILK